jgi:hypothetical protein
MRIIKINLNNNQLQQYNINHQYKVHNNQNINNLLNINNLIQKIIKIIRII